MSMLGELLMSHSFLHRSTEDEWHTFAHHFYELLNKEIKKSLIENGATPIVVENVVEVQKEITVDDAIAMLEAQGFTVSKPTPKTVDTPVEVDDSELALWAFVSLLSFIGLWILLDIHFIISVIGSIVIGLIPVVLEIGKKPVDTSDQNLYN